MSELRAPPALPFGLAVTGAALDAFCSRNCELCLGLEPGLDRRCASTPDPASIPCLMGNTAPADLKLQTDHDASGLSISVRAVCRSWRTTATSPKLDAYDVSLAFGHRFRDIGSHCPALR